MEFLEHAFIFLTSVFSSFIGTIVGGMGLLIVPALMFVGLSAQVAVASTRIGTLGGNAISIYQFHKSKKIDYAVAIPMMITSAIGAYIGSNALLITPTEVVEKVFGVFILIIVALSLFKKDVGVVKKERPSWKLQALGHTGLFFISIIGSYFSGGGGLLGRSLLMHCFGLTFLESAGTKKLQSAVVGLMAGTVFITSGAVDWRFAATLFVGITLGSYLGTAYALKKGDEWVRKIFILAVVLSAIELLLM